MLAYVSGYQMSILSRNVVAAKIFSLHPLRIKVYFHIQRGKQLSLRNEQV